MLKKTSLRRLWVLLAACLTPNLLQGGIIGDPAPPLVVKEWIKGGPLTFAPGTNVYVVEIWNTTSMGTRAAITNLNKIAAQSKTNGVVVIGISDEPPEKIREFVEHGAGTNITFAIAADEKRQTSLAFMTPVKQRGIPFSFVVGTNGNIMWYGPPLGALHQAVKLILAGQYDFDRAQKNELGFTQMEQYLGLARRGDFRAQAAGRVLLANRTNDVELLCDLAYQISTAQRLPHPDFSLAGEALDQAEKLTSTTNAPVMINRAVWLFASGKQDAGLLLATQALASAQSPLAQKNIQMLLHTMQMRVTEAAASKVGTNHITEAQSPDFHTNQSTAFPH